MGTLLRALCHSVRGAAMAEAAICLPILLLVLFSMVDMSRLLWARHVGDLACREAARIAVLPDPAGGTSDSKALVRANSILADSGMTTKAGFTIVRQQTTIPYTVTVSTQIDFSFVMIGGFIPEVLSLNAVAASAQAVQEPR